MAENTDIIKKEEAMPEKSRDLPAAVPLVDIYENDDEILLHADMPGVHKDDIRIHMENGRLMISGIRKLEKTGAANWSEFGNVEFRRAFSVPQDIDTDGVNALLREGVLRLHLPKSERAKPRQIEITAE